MSTSFGMLKILSGSNFLVSAAIILAGVSAWNGSTSAGGDHKNEIVAVVRSVATSVPMTPMCKIIAIHLTEMSVNETVTKMRPTHSYWTDKANVASQAWESSQCPTSALVGLTFGAAEISGRDHWMRRDQSRNTH